MSDRNLLGRGAWLTLGSLGRELPLPVVVGDLILVSKGRIAHFAHPLSTPGENPTVPPIENPTDRRGDEPQAVATS